jgi:hypothetical protein
MASETISEVAYRYDSTQRRRKIKKKYLKNRQVRKKFASVYHFLRSSSD